MIPSKIYKDHLFGVFGLGLSGISTMRYLIKKGAKFIACDDNQNIINNIVNSYPYLAKYIWPISEDAWKNIDFLILSPGIALHYPIPHNIVAIASKAKIICDIELLYLDSQDCKFIGVTGTNGKSTTAALIAHILKYNNLNVALAGNIGIPVLDVEVSKNIIFVLELSSFQLDLIDKAKFDVAVLLNITPDHLDRHGNMENYINTKYKIFSQLNPENAIINTTLKQIDGSVSFSCAADAQFRVNDNILYHMNQQYSLPINNSLLGTHNQENIAAAIACCIKIGLSIADIINALPSFVGLNHRMQYLGKYKNILFINDSKATNADSTAKALSSFDNIIWIAGGLSKEGGIEALKEFFPKIKHALLIGGAQDELSKTCSNLVKWTKCNNLEAAFNFALSIAKSGDVVLLSPACASYDQWKNFEERGNAFISLFNNLLAKNR
jgi:UDP-N-acetylmuramoylalanine--D-glutamate ligase